MKITTLELPDVTYATFEEALDAVEPIVVADALRHGRKGHPECDPDTLAQEGRFHLWYVWNQVGPGAADETLARWKLPERVNGVRLVKRWRDGFRNRCFDLRRSQLKVASRNPKREIRLASQADESQEGGGGRAWDTVAAPGGENTVLGQVIVREVLEAVRSQCASGWEDVTDPTTGEVEQVWVERDTERATFDLLVDPPEGFAVEGDKAPRITAKNLADRMGLPVSRVKPALNFIRQALGSALGMEVPD